MVDDEDFEDEALGPHALLALAVCAAVYLAIGILIGWTVRGFF